MKKRSDTEKLMTVKEVCAALDLHQSTLSNWRKRGIGLRYIKLGSQYFYDAAEIREFGRTYIKGAALSRVYQEETT